MPDPFRWALFPAEELLTVTEVECDTTSAFNKFVGRKELFAKLLSRCF